MAVTLNNNTDCCESTCTNSTVNVAGPTGPAGATGATGTNGSDGLNAFATTNNGNSVAVPAVSGNAGLNVDHPDAFITGQTVYIQGFGYYEVLSTSGGYMSVKNLGYTGNATSGTIGTGIKISPAGIKGADGAGGITYPAGFAQKGDLLTHDGSTYTDQSIGSANTQALFVDSTAGNGMTWRQPKFADFNAATDKLNLATHTDTATQLALTQIGNAGGGAGDLAYWNGTNWVRIPAGTSGQRLVFDTTLGRPKWSSAGGVEVIAKANVIYETTGSTITLSSIVNIGNPTVNTSTLKIFLPFEEDLPTTQPTVLIGARDANSNDIICSNIITTGSGRGVEFLLESNSPTEFHFALLD